MKVNWKQEIKKSLTSMVMLTMVLYSIIGLRVASVKNGEALIEFRNWEFLSFLPEFIQYFIVVLPLAFLGSLLWRYLMRRRDSGEKKTLPEIHQSLESIQQEAPNGFVRFWVTAGKFLLGVYLDFMDYLKKSRENKTKSYYSMIAGVLLLVSAYPFLAGMYRTNIMITALIYILLGLGLNIILGLGGLLNLGHGAFFAVGAYTYGLAFKYLSSGFAINLPRAGIHFVFEGLASESLQSGWLFWASLPLAGLIAAIFGILICLPVLRLRGDYLAIVTLAFGEITKIVIQNMSNVTGGSTGISQIPRPWLFGINVTPRIAAIYIYFIVLALVVLTIIVVSRLENSRIGRAWEAMREDEIASQSMGIDIVKNKLTAFALGAVSAGVAGVVFAAQTTYINPGSFTIWESIVILMVVVIGGTGSIPGVILGALIIKLLPESFRALSEYRMLIFGAVLVLMMIFRPEGIIKKVRRVYKFKKSESTTVEDA